MSDRFTDPERVKELIAFMDRDLQRQGEKTPEHDRAYAVQRAINDRYGEGALEKLGALRRWGGAVGIILRVADELEAERSREIMATGAAALEAAHKVMQDKPA